MIISPESLGKRFLAFIAIFNRFFWLEYRCFSEDLRFFEKFLFSSIRIAALLSTKYFAL